MQGDAQCLELADPDGQEPTNGSTVRIFGMCVLGTVALAMLLVACGGRFDSGAAPRVTVTNDDASAADVGADPVVGVVTLTVDPKAWMSAVTFWWNDRA